MTVVHLSKLKPSPLDGGHLEAIDARRFFAFSTVVHISRVRQGVDISLVIS